MIGKEDAVIDLPPLGIDKRGGRNVVILGRKGLVLEKILGEALRDNSGKTSAGGDPSLPWECF